MAGTSGARALHRLTQSLGSHDLVVSFTEDWHVAVKADLATNVRPKPTVRGTLGMLSGAGHRMGVATSTHGHRARQHLEVANLLHFFERLTGGDEVAAIKAQRRLICSAWR